MPDQAKNELVAAYKNVPTDRLVPDYLWKLAAVVSGTETLEEIMSPATIRTMQDAAAVSAAEAKSIALCKIADAAKVIDINDQDAVRELRRMLENLEDVQPDDEYASLCKGIEEIYNKK